MSKSSEQKQQQADSWTWIAVGLVFGAVIVALYGPFLWELIHSA
jgi:hypothetical protein